MTAVPIATGVTTPFSTVATVGVSLFQTTVLFVAFSGSIFTVRGADAPPTVSSSASLSNAIPVTAILPGFTVTTHSAVAFPALALIVAVPSDTGVTIPSTTVATASEEELHVTVLSVASSGVIVAVSVAVWPPAVSSNSLSLRLIPVTSTIPFASIEVLSVATEIGRTITMHSATNPPACAEIIAEPSAIGVTNPSFTVATSSEEVSQITLLSVASSGKTVAARATDASPTVSVSLFMFKLIPDIGTSSTSNDSTSLSHISPSER